MYNFIRSGDEIMNLREELLKFEEKSNDQVIKENKLIQSFNHYINTGEIEQEDKEEIINIVQKCMDKYNFDDCIFRNEIEDALKLKKIGKINTSVTWKTKCSEKINQNVQYSEIPKLIKLIIKEYEIVNTVNKINSVIEIFNLPKLHRNSNLSELAEICTKSLLSPAVDQKNSKEPSVVLTDRTAYLYKLMYDFDFIEDNSAIIYLYMYKMTNENKDGFILFKGEVYSLLARYDTKRYVSFSSNFPSTSGNKKIVDDLIKNGEKLGIKCIDFDEKNCYFTLEGYEDKGKIIFENRMKLYKQKDLIGKVLFEAPYKEIKKNLDNNINFSAMDILKKYNIDGVVINNDTIYLSKKNYYMIDTNNKTVYYQAKELDSVIEFEKDEDYEIDMSGLMINPKSSGSQKNVMGNAMLGAMIAGSTGAIIGAATAMDYNNRNANINRQEHKLIHNSRQRVKNIFYYDSIEAKEICIATCSIARYGKEGFPSWITTVSAMLTSAINLTLDKDIIEFIIKYQCFDQNKYKEYVSRKFWLEHKEEKIKYEKEQEKLVNEINENNRCIDELTKEEENIQKQKIKENTATTDLHNKIDELKVLYNELDTLGMFSISRQKTIKKQIEILDVEKKELSKKSKEMTKAINEKYRDELNLIKEKRSKLYQKNKELIDELAKYEYYIKNNIIN